jgi:hypothetical protein
MKSEWKRLLAFAWQQQLHRDSGPRYCHSGRPIAFACQDLYPRVRALQHLGFVLALFTLLCCSTWQCYGADILECPEIGAASVPDLIGDASGGGLFVTESRVDLANEINESINRLQIASPNISSTDVQNVLIAAYCRVVAHKPGLSGSEKWSRMRQFDSILEQQIAANITPAGTLIIANVPLPPEVFRELRKQAAFSHQTTAQLMAAILTRAAGR